MSLQNHYKENALILYKKYFCLRLYENIFKTLILGSSHGFYGYRANQEYNEINMADASQDLYYSYCIYKTFANSPNLKNVILFYSVFSPGHILELTEEKWRCDIYKAIYNFPYRFTLEQNRTSIVESIANFISEQQNKKINTEYIGNCSYNFFLDFKVNLQERVKAHLTNNRRPQNQTEYVRKSLLLAKEKGHNLYVVIPPLRSDYTNLLPPFEELFPDLLNLKDVKIISFLGDARFEDSDFGDMDHLNQKGAEKLTYFIRQATQES